MRSSLTVALTVAAALLIINAAPCAGSQFRDITSCQECLDAGYGWSERKRKCGYFKKQPCKGGASDKSATSKLVTLKKLKSLTDNTFASFAYTPGKVTLVAFYSAAESKQKKPLEKLAADFATIQPDLADIVQFASVNVDRFPELATKVGIELLTMPTIAAFQESNKLTQDGYSSKPAQLSFRAKHTHASYIEFVTDLLEDQRVRIPAIDQRVPAFMAALTGASGENATEIYLATSNFTMELVADLHKRTNETQAEYDRLVEARRLAEELRNATAAAAGDEDGDAASASVDADGTVKAEEEAEEPVPLPSFDEETLALLASVSRNGHALYLDIMLQAVEQGVAYIVRETNHLKTLPDPRPLAARHRLQIIQVFADELF